MTKIVWWVLGVGAVLIVLAVLGYYFLWPYKSSEPSDAHSFFVQTDKVTPTQQSRNALLQQISPSTPLDSPQAASEQQARAQLLQQVSSRPSSSTPTQPAAGSASADSSASQQDRAALLNSLKSQ